MLKLYFKERRVESNRSLWYAVNKETREYYGEEKINELKNLATQLNQAYEGMFVWMRQYNNEDGEQTPEEVKAYLEGQMIQVTKVNEDIKAALDKAAVLLAN